MIGQGEITLKGKWAPLDQVQRGHSDSEVGEALKQIVQRSCGCYLTGCAQDQLDEALSQLV